MSFNQVFEDVSTKKRDESMERMANLIPVLEQGEGGKTSPIKEDVMSPQLRAQFRALQHLHCNQQRKRSRIDIEGRPGTAINTSTGDPDDETSSMNQIVSNCSHPSLDMSNQSHDDMDTRSSHGHTCAHDQDSLSLRMAISTAISAQNEIDTLLKGITELESMVNEQGFCNGDDDSNKSDLTGETQTEGADETSLLTIID
eukprot:CAMPEP_0204633328 /NCGR_PEP_ID=MMETSP0717-20131115/26931_1 /ASSEMBLY_ACC=CAM_ASM_000666 /TAXON_ID=230516 /ORGANISM="Chaetoceros curvisetus" /LENGTH=199 /DNA_ID=CAMNT_0051651453 /DNA_START=239 /DNA_END=838 /DNA_ORIENTATION=+